MLTVHSTFYTLQGEGRNTGCPAVFVRLAGCNLWSGREQDRALGTGSCSRWCDTEFGGTGGSGGGRYTSMTLAERVKSLWPSRSPPFVVFTGGEPLLQLTAAVLLELRHLGLRKIAVETNGTLLCPSGAIDWICVSPKAGQRIVQKQGDELKVIWPQQLNLERLREMAFFHFFLQPMDGPKREENVKTTVDYCLTHPEWRLSLQTHKLLGIP